MGKVINISFLLLKTSRTLTMLPKPMQNPSRVPASTGSHRVIAVRCPEAEGPTKRPSPPLLNPACPLPQDTLPLFRQFFYNTVTQIRKVRNKEIRRTCGRNTNSGTRPPRRGVVLL